ncbi:hypothetical protein AC579_147 [Pseudocercospora musae]|uniref:Uncharacterized protein n=1 Tax=Pseudocercospora musae TaxID=113226 RepID=A0A139ILN8_9PEZI|nr:hypothetical protein AC579_147 [Pseudocercospora musae]
MPKSFQERPPIFFRAVDVMPGEWQGEKEQQQQMQSEVWFTGYLAAAPAVNFAYNKSTSQPVNQSTSQSVNQSISQSVNESTSQPAN